MGGTLGPTQPPVQWVPGVLSPELKRGRGVTLTTHPHLAPRSRMSRSYNSSPPSAFVACSGTALALTQGDYFNLAKPSKDLFTIFMLCFCPAFLCDINVYLIFSGFTSRPTSLLAQRLFLKAKRKWKLS
jgi:hypothetical protein